MEKNPKTAALKYFTPVSSSEIISKKVSGIDLSGALKGLSGTGSNDLFLKRLSVEDCYRLFEESGFLDYLKSIGLRDIKIKVSEDEYGINYLKLYYKAENPANLLMDLRVTESSFNPDTSICGEDTFAGPLYMVVIEWLSLQNPFKDFDDTRPRLPGQEKPGLGALNYCFKLMYAFGSELVKDGFMDVPDHMSGAIMYSRKFKFFDPRHEAILHAVIRDLEGYSLRDISWGMITKTVIDEYKNIPQVYDPSEQIFPTSDRMKKYFKSRRYTAVYNKYYKRKRYRFDYEKMIEKREEILKKKDESEI